MQDYIRDANPSISIDRSIGMGVYHLTRGVLWLGRPWWFTRAGKAYRRTHAKLR